MSKPAIAIESIACDWLDKKTSAKYLQYKGFYSITQNSILHASRVLKTLHDAKRVGNTYFWHKDWLDEWVESL